MGFKRYRGIKNYKDIKGVTRAIGRTPYLGGKRAYTGSALKYLHRYLFASLPKKTIKRVAVVVTTSKSRNDVRLGASGLKATGVEVFVVQIGKNFSKVQLRQIATSPRHIFYVPNVKYLPRLVKILKEKACRRAPKPNSRFISFHTDTMTLQEETVMSVLQITVIF